ncbi:unnamed protein product [Lactuca virosa]|uniref:DUF4283 domain-containing protein n=1 Tax=Lactuca virosa TaxID=75947 RepID=A0AAU9P254_9ASTR|nr:unnamed protein product [Lactuca virosa]
MDREGLPLSAWSAAAFMKVASIFGRVLYVDEDLDEHMSSGKVCIVAPVSGYIKDHLLVTIEGLKYNIHVKEIVEWCPDIERFYHVVQDESNGNEDKAQHEEKESSDENSIDGGEDGDCNGFLSDEVPKEDGLGNDKYEGFKERVVEDVSVRRKII